MQEFTVHFKAVAEVSTFVRVMAKDKDEAEEKATKLLHDTKPGWSTGGPDDLSEAVAEVQ